MTTEHMNKIREMMASAFTCDAERESLQVALDELEALRQEVELLRPMAMYPGSPRAAGARMEWREKYGGGR